jgi:hypothetical protein
MIQMRVQKQNIRPKKIHELSLQVLVFIHHRIALIPHKKHGKIAKALLFYYNFLASITIIE